VSDLIRGVNFSVRGYVTTTNGAITSCSGWWEIHWNGGAGD
jgi:hypothetical protein